MSTRTQAASMFWRWVLIVSELLVAANIVVVQLAGRYGLEETGLFLIVGILTFGAWVFLFLGSPFLVSSHRWLAILTKMSESANITALNYRPALDAAIAFCFAFARHLEVPGPPGCALR